MPCSAPGSPPGQHIPWSRHIDSALLALAMSQTSIPCFLDDHDSFEECWSAVSVGYLSLRICLIFFSRLDWDYTFEVGRSEKCSAISITSCLGRALPKWSVSVGVDVGHWPRWCSSGSPVIQSLFPSASPDGAWVRNRSEQAAHVSEAGSVPPLRQGRGVSVWMEWNSVWDFVFSPWNSLLSFRIPREGIKIASW